MWKLNLLSNRYEMGELLATGGMAEVYVAQFKPSAGVCKAVVIKKILKPYERDPQWISSFLKEAKIMAMLSHSNIVQVIDFGRSASSYFLVMEYVDGATLLDLGERQPIFPQNMVLYIALELLKGLSYAHQKGVLHRDISPSNVLISRAGEVKLTDFGVAKLLKETLEPTRFLRGKKAYMSPEQKAKQSLSEASDLYSLCLVCYELLTGSLEINEAWLEKFPYLRAGLCPDPSQRTQRAAELEARLMVTIREKNIFVNSAEFSKFIFPHLPASNDLTLPLRGRGLFESDERPVKQWVKQLRWGVGGLWLLLGLTPPEFYSHGFLSVNVKPWGDVYLYSKSLGSTPLLQQSIPTGRHTVLIRNEKLQKTKKVEVVVEPYQAKTILHQF